jgi:putative ABC transport system permease protein
MFKNYLKIAIRNILRHRFYSIINIVGLAIGIACFIMIGMWVQDELSYDKHFTKSDRIYRIANDLLTNGIPSPMAAADPRITEHIRAEYPEVENVARMLNVPTMLTANEKELFETKTFYADSTFFDIFSYDFVEGNPQTALRSREAIVLTESIARKLFGKESPMGKTIYVKNEKTKNEKLPRLVTGVIKDNKDKAHFIPLVIMSKFRYMDMFEHTYALFKKDYDPQRFVNHVWPELYGKHFKKEYAEDAQGLTLTLQPLTKIHLQSDLLYELEPNGNIYTVYTFSIIAFLILLIAAINYMNLATAKSYDRSREVGVRKVLGATRKQIVIQFLTESTALALLALVLALAFVELTLPFFNKLSEKNMSLNLLQPLTAISVLGLTILLGLLSGAYPAFFVSSFAPIKALKGTMDTTKNKPTLRKALVVVQFSVSIVMLIATIVVTRQLSFVKNKDLGFSREQVLLISLNDPAIRSKTELIKTELLKNPSIRMVSASHNVPGSEMYKFYHKFETPEGNMEARLVTTMLTDYDYHGLMGFQFVAGTPYEKSMMPQLDSSLFIIVNESAVKMLGWKDPIGKNVSTGNSGGLRKGKCIGVIKDFHTASLHEEIPPMVFRLARKGFYFLSIKISTGNIPGTINYVEQTMKSFTRGYPFEYSFLDESFNKQYAKDERQHTIFKWFAGLCIFISCLGLMGLASFSTKQRTKEIGIRKISGASVSDIVILISKDFVKLVLIAIIIAIPIAYYAMNKWLQNFAYHIEIGWAIFLVAGVIALLIALATISLHTIRAANKNPAGILKYE